MIKQYNVTVNGTTYEVTVESAAGGRMASAPVPRRPRGHGDVHRARPAFR